MAENISNLPKTLAPRKLEYKETLNSLNQWRTIFRNYYRRCPYYGQFLLSTTTWNNSPSRGFTAETTGLRRDIPTLVSDLEGFLDCIASFLPFDYISEKLKQESSNISSVWEIVYEVYDAELTTTNFLDYGTMTRQDNETYRSYYTRLVGFVRQRLPQQAITSEGVSCPDAGEQLSIGLLDAIAIHWLISINPKLLGIIKTEFATDLKTKRLCQMVKPISRSIDDLLKRYDTKDQVAMVTSKTPAANDDVTALIRRIDQLEVNQAKFQPRRRWPPNNNNNRKQSADRCSHYKFLNKQLGANLRVDHASVNCGKKNVSINLIESLPDTTDDQ